MVTSLALRVGAEALGAEMLFRIRGLRGLTVDKVSPIPWFPNGTSDLPLKVDTGQPLDGHTCSHVAPAIVLPAVLVVPMKFRDLGGYRYWFDSFDPYWLTDVLVQHAAQPAPDPNQWRPGALSEIVPGIAEFPEVGSLRVTAKSAAEVGWNQSSVQVYLDSGEVKAHCGGSPRGHHAVYVQRCQAPRPPRTLLNC